MRRPLVIGNWKMNGSLPMIQEFLPAMAARVRDDVDVAICIPSVYLQEAARHLADSACMLGAQTVSDRGDGRYTGEVSARMLAEVGCKIAIVGHSERRQNYRESDEQVAQQCLRALESGIAPVFCVGETMEEKRDSAVFQVVGEQLMALFDTVPAEMLGQLVVAYEPVWAIGTGQTPDAGEVQEIHEFIRAVFSDTNADLAAGLRVIYGGSITPENARGFFCQPDIDGGLVGSASIDKARFSAVCDAAAC